MRIVTVLLGAVAAIEMNAEWNTVGSGIMGKVTLLTSGTMASQKVWAYGNLVDVVSEFAAVTQGANTCEACQ